MTAKLETEGPLTDLPADVQLVVYRVAQEALSNAAQHSDASNVAVRIASRPGFVDLTVDDDGIGFSFEQGGRGLGLGGMRERALLVDGYLDSSRGPTPAQGSISSCRYP